MERRWRASPNRLYSAEIVCTRTARDALGPGFFRSFQNMKQRPHDSATQESIARTPDATSQPLADSADKKWQIDQASGVPAPVIRANMISLRLSYQGRVKVAFFEQD